MSPGGAKPRPFLALDPEGEKTNDRKLLHFVIIVSFALLYRAPIDDLLDFDREEK